MAYLPPRNPDSHEVMHDWLERTLASTASVATDAAPSEGVSADSENAYKAWRDGLAACPALLFDVWDAGWNAARADPPAVAADAAAQPCGVCEGDCGAEASGYACAVQTDERAACVHADNPRACYRVRCQLGNKCVDDDMAPRAATPQSGEKAIGHIARDDVHGWHFQLNYGYSWDGLGEGFELFARAVAPQSALSDDSHRFKNFHRLLCERFDYVHDEKDWRRDQISLIEHIAARSTLSAERMSDADEPSIRALYEDACIQANKNAEDAARYRWLKMRSSIPDQQRIMLSTPWGQWDAAIDAFRKAEIKREEGQS